MKKLKVRQTLLLLGLLFATPFAAVVAYDLLFVKAPRDLGNVRAEIAAVSVQTRLVKLLHELQVYRDLGHAIANTNDVLRKDFNEQPAAVQLAVKQTDDAVAPAAERVEGLGDEWRKLKSQIEDALKHPAYEKPALAYADRKKLIEEAKALVVFAGDKSGLSDIVGTASDRKVDVAYHFMTAFQYRGPDLMDALSNARAICVGLASRRSVVESENQRAEFDELERNLSRIEFELTSSEGTLFTAVARVMRDRLDLKPRFDTEFQVARAGVDEAARLIRRTLNQRRADASAKDFHETLTRATAAVLRLEDKLALTLDEVIKARMDTFKVDVLKTLAMVTVSMLVVLVIALLTSNGITKPFDDIVEVADQIAEGDLTANVAAVERTDEIGGLLRALNRMVRSLTDLVSQVQKSGLQVNTSVNQISVTGKQQQTTANEIASTATEIGATAKEISATSLELVNMMKDATAVAEDTASLATKGQEGLTRMRETMTQLTDAAGIIQSKLGVLNEKAANINQVVTAITKIADRTNLLSLNAAIEAEKAGEYGRGFSVVATEIRRLADQTAVATYDIEQMVKEMQAAVSAGTLGMNQTAEDIRSGVKEVQAVGAQLAQIIQQVQALAPRFELVNSGMQSQATGGQQISDSLSQLTKAVQQTAQSLEQSNQAIEQLKSTAYALREGVARFKLPGGR